MGAPELGNGDTGMWTESEVREACLKELVVPGRSR